MRLARRPAGARVLINKEITSRLAPARSFALIASRSVADVITRTKASANGLVPLSSLACLSREQWRTAVIGIFELRGPQPLSTTVEHRDMVAALLLRKACIGAAGLPEAKRRGLARCAGLS